MGIESLYADDIEKGLQFRLRNPQPEEPPASFSLSSFAGAGFKSLGVGGFQALANAADMAKAFQGADADGGANPFSTAAQDAEGAAGLAARQKALTQGNAALRQRAAELAPDPIMAHRADQVISGVGAGLTKAVTAIGTLGPVAGSAVFGAGEADTTFREAIDRGLDSDTATKLAATTGIISGATAGLPAGGSTIARTAGIATVAGPASFMAQEAISRRILQNAGHADEAAMHDPTDPWGLALSVALPYTMGAIHARGLPARVAPRERIEPTLADVALDLESKNRRYGADGKLLTSPAGAQGERQVMPATQLDPGFGVRPAALGPDGKPTPDEIARVGVDYIAAMQTRYGGDPAKTLAAYNAGPGRLDAAIAAHGEGWLAHMPDETKAYVTKGLGKLGDHAVTRAARDPETVDAARAQLASRALSENLPDHPEAAAGVRDASDLIARGETPEAAPIDLSPYEVRAPRFPDTPVLATGESGTVTLKDGTPVTLTRIPDAATFGSGSEIRATTADGAEIGRVSWLHPGDPQRGGDNVTPLDSMVSPQFRRLGLGTHLYDAVENAGARIKAADGLVSEDAQALRTARAARPPREVDAAPPARPDAGPLVRARARSPAEQPGTAPGKPPSAAEIHAALTKPEPGPAPGAAPAAKPAAEPVSLEVQRAEAAIADNPDLRVQLPGSTETVSAAEALARVKAEAAHDATEVDLIRAAVQCALTFGN